MSKTFTYSALSSFAQQIFLKIGCSEKDADLATKSLLIADLRGFPVTYDYGKLNELT
jgi:LDH2 family malate/lactate/ureidoglycolate dehydrogenase